MSQDLPAFSGSPGLSSEGFPPALLGPVRPGARVALLGTAGPPVTAALDGAIETVRGWGLEPVAYASARAEHPRAPYLTGPDRLRADDFTAAWCDESIEAIFCVRGGYGTVRMLDLLDPQTLRTARPKPVFGSSDVTALHEYLAERIGVPSWFTPMLATRAVQFDDVAREQLRKAVLEGVSSVRLPSVAEMSGATVLVPGAARGRLVGGNLSLLAMTLAARGRPPVDNTGAIVVLEDIGEDTYRLDGFLMSLLRSGWFDGVAGIVLGSWLDCQPDEVRALCIELLGPLGVPMVFGMPIGHDVGAASVPLGVAWELDLTDGDGRIGVVNPENSPTVATSLIK